MVWNRLSKHAGLGRRVSVEHHVAHPGEDQHAKPIGPVCQVHQDGEYEYMNKAFGELPVVERTHAGNAAQHGCQPWTRGAGWSVVNRDGNVGCSRRDGTFETRGKAVLAVNHAAYIALAALAQGLTAGATVRCCLLIGVNGASHASKLLIDKS